ncbi:TonB-dependent receptor domain-containing protein [Allohahella marinimesophila]|uniref:TonB-dependent siderophore receptor FetA/FrpB n=1 Tax=Allohahella marinimesophila TaxID=1054972 RepID=A0ABP7NY15_9GAMM
MSAAGQSLFRRTILSIAISGVMVSSPAMAEAESAAGAGEVIELGTMTVVENTPENAEQVVTREDIEQLQANDLEDVFRADPSVAVGGANSVSQKIYVRGLEDTLLNVTIDGATQAGYLFHHQGRISIEPELLKQVGIQAGAGDATNGPGALGGAIRFVTVDPEDLLRPDERIGALLKAGYFSNTEGYKASTTLFGRMSDDWSAMASLSKLDEGEFTDGNGDELKFTDAEEEMGFAKIVGKLGGGQTLKLSYELQDTDGFRLERPHWIPSERNNPIDQRGERETTTFNYLLQPEGSDVIDMRATVYQTDAFLEQDGRFGLYYGGVESRGIDLRNTSRLGAHSLTYGVDHREDEGTLENRSDATVPTETEEATVTGVYIQDQYALADQWLLSLGTRYDIFRLDDANDQKFRETGFSPNAGITYSPTERLDLFLTYAEALRGKLVNETFVLDFYTNSPDLEAEEAKNAELGFNYVPGALSVSAKVYASRIDNVIDDVENVLTNVGDLENEGFFTKVGYQWDQVFAALSFNYSRPEIEGVPLHDDNWSVGTSIGDTWVAELHYQHSESLQLGWYGRIVQRLETVADGYNEKAGYGVHDLYAEWLPLQRDELKLTLTLKNIFDKYYRDHASYGDYGPIAQGFPEPGRDARLSVAWRI